MIDLFQNIVLLIVVIVMARRGMVIERQCRRIDALVQSYAHQQLTLTVMRFRMVQINRALKAAMRGLA